MKLGMFDSPERVRWAQIPFSVLDQPAHRDLARQVARESIVLLKNDRNTLPLRKNLGTIAVIGPNADQWRMLLGNYNGIPKSRSLRSAASARRSRAPARACCTRSASDLAEGFPVLSSMRRPPCCAHRTDKPGLRAEYFASKAMDGAPVFTATDTVVEADWSEAAPRPEMNANDFGVRWSGTFTPPVTGTYRLGVIGTMRVQLFLDDSVIVRSVYPQRDNEFPDPRLSQSDQARPLQLEGGRSYRLRLEAAESYGEAQAQLVWAPPSGPLEEAALAAAQQADAVVLVLGLTANLEGEEMRVQIPGFRGGDRTSIDLPASQQRLLEKVVAVGKPTVLVLLNGSAIAVNWAQQNVPAIVEAWYPGQAGGNAIADVLFGDYNPAGRLPVTFYKSVSDLPPFEDYAMKGRTYRYFTGTPLYPFGHGLSYTTFAYRNLRASAERVTAAGTIGVSVDVTNSGAVAGDEVVQLYVSHPGVEGPARDQGAARLSARDAEPGRDAHGALLRPRVVARVLERAVGPVGRRERAGEGAGGRIVGRHPRRAHDPGHWWRSEALSHPMSRAAMRRRVLIVAGVALALTPATRVSAQQPTPTIARDDARFSFYDRGPYRPGIPRPESLLGYPIGEQNTQYAAQERTLLAIADAAKDRVRVEEFTTTYERRTMRLYIVSSPENIARLDAIRRDLDRIADPRGGSPAELDALAARVPAVVWISGSVHGNESPGFETCIQLLYQLAASEEPATLAALRNTIVIINPSSNPDGHERFTVWYNSVSVGAADPRAMEHVEPWSVQGRYNHYRFDMNRDLIASTQREVQGTMRMMLKWHPMVVADLHGHVSTYFFPPAARPVNANIVGDPGSGSSCSAAPTPPRSTAMAGCTTRATSTTSTTRATTTRGRRSTARSA